MISKTIKMAGMKRKSMSEQDLEAARRLKALWNSRKADLDLTQDKAAELLGFGTQGAVSHYLNGKTPLNIEAVIKFAGLLQVAPEFIRPDLIDMFRVIRQYSPDADPLPPQPIAPQLTEKQRKMVELADDLPDSEAEQIIRDMEQKRDYYRRKVQELLDKRNKPA